MPCTKRRNTCSAALATWCFAALISSGLATSVRAQAPPIFEETPQIPIKPSSKKSRTTIEVGSQADSDKSIYEKTFLKSLEGFVPQSRTPSIEVHYSAHVDVEGPKGSSGVWDMPMPEGYSYCTHHVSVESRSPKNERSHWVTQTANGIRMDYDVPGGSGWISNPFPGGGWWGGSSNWLKLEVTLIGWKTGITSGVPFCGIGWYWKDRDSLTPRLACPTTSIFKRKLFALGQSLGFSARVLSIACTQIRKALAC